MIEHMDTNKREELEELKKQQAMSDKKVANAEKAIQEAAALLNAESDDAPKEGWWGKWRREKKEKKNKNKNDGLLRFNLDNKRDSAKKAKKTEAKKTKKGEGKGAKDKEEQIKTPDIKKEEVLNFVRDLLPQSFHELHDELKQKKVLQDLERRIVDLIKSDAKTQYSDGLKKKVQENAGKSVAWLRNAKDSVKSGFTKNKDLKNLEKQAIKEFISSETGKAQVRADLDVLIQKVENQEIENGTRGKEQILYVNYAKELFDTYGEIPEIQDFNNWANEFADIPYEWGQEKKGSNKKEYDRVYVNYKEARDKLENKIKEIDGEAVALVNMLQLDNSVRMEQLLNTHPEFESALNDLGREAGFWETSKTVVELVKGKKFEKLILLMGGAGARWAARLAPIMIAGVTTAGTAVTLAATPVIGGAIGWYRGKWRAEDIVTEKGQEARSGSTVTQEERETMASQGQKTEFQKKLEELRKNPAYLALKEKLEQATTNNDIEGVKRIQKEIEIMNSGIKRELVGKTQNSQDLNDKIEKMILDIRLMTPMTPEQEATKALKINLLKRRIDYIKNQVENGLVDFGDAQSSLANQHEFIRWLNNALVTVIDVDTNEVSEQFYQKLEKLIVARDQKIDASQIAFIKKQAKTARNWGAGFALAGYGAKWLLEHTSLFGGDTTGSSPKINEALKNTPASEKGTIEEYYEWIKGKIWSTESSKSTHREFPDGTKVDLYENQQVKSITEPDGSKMEYDESGKMTSHVSKDGKNLPLTETKTSEEFFEEKKRQFPTKTVNDENPDKIPNSKTTKENDGNNIIEKNKSLPEDTVIRKGEGIEHAFIRQIENNPKLAEELGFKGGDAKALHAFAQKEAHVIALKTGYVDAQGHEVRVGVADKASYEIKTDGNGKVSVEEKFEDKVIETRNEGTKFTENPNEYEFKKNSRTIPRSPRNENYTAEEATRIKNTRSRIDKSFDGTRTQSRVVIEQNTEIIPNERVTVANTEIRQNPQSETGNTGSGSTDANAVKERVINKIDNPTGTVVDRNPQLRGTVFEKNELGLTDQQLVETSKVHQENLTYISKNPAYDYEDAEDKPAKNFIDAKTGEGDRIVPYLTKLRKVSDLAPAYSNIDGDEPVGKYIPRALQKIAKDGRLDEVRITEK